MTARAKRAKGPASWMLGLASMIALAVASIIAFSGLLGLQMPWQGGYEVKAVFASAQDIRRDSPVRIAGVEVGKVTGVEHLEGAEGELAAQTGEDPEPTSGRAGRTGTVVTMDVTEDALPIKSDARFKIRPRLFLEGNYFIELEPGSPGAEEIDEGHTFPVNQTEYSVQLDQVLTTLQSGVRRDLQILLDEFGDALVKHGGAEGFRQYSASSAAANKFTSQVNEALLGTHAGDLGGTIRGLDRVVRGLGRNPQTLQELVTNFRTVAGSFAAEDAALGRAIERLPAVLRSADPAFRNLNRSFPTLRAFAREALPGVRSAPETLRVATPFITQVRELVSRRELRGLVADLRPTIPELARLTREATSFMPQARALSSCFNEVIIPWAHDSVDPVDPTGIYPHDAAGRVFEETGYLLTGLTGIGRSGDANGQYARVLLQVGTNILQLPGTDTEPGSFSLLPYELLGAMPAPGSVAKTRFTAEHPCERQEPPNLEGTFRPAPEQTQLPGSTLLPPSADRDLGELERP